MKRVMLFILAALVALVVAGCGGGGGGSTPTTKETRSANIATAQFGSAELKGKTLSVYWTGDKTATNYGRCIVESVSKLAGTGTLSLNQDGTINLINDLASDTFRFTFVTTHPSGTGDPDAGKTVTGTAVVTIVPQNTSASPTNFDIPQGGSMQLVVRAQNARASGAEIVRINDEITRALVNVEAAWLVDPGNAGAVTKNATTSYTYKGSTDYVGTFSLQAHVANALDQPAAVSGRAIAHPTIGCSNPAEGATVSGTVSVQFTAQNVNTVFWKVDDGTETEASSNAFPLDTTVLPNGTHTLTFRAVGPLETATLTRSFTVDNQASYDPGKAGTFAFSGDTFNTNVDGLNKLVSTFYRLSTGGYIAVDSADTIRFFSADGKTVVNTVQTASWGTTCAVMPNGVVWAHRQSYGDIKRYDKDGQLLGTLYYPGVTSLSYVAQTGKVIASSANGIREYDPSSLTYTTLRTDAAYAACGDERYIFYQGVGDGSDPTGLTIWKLDRVTGQIKAFVKTGIAYSMYSPPGFNLVIVANKTTKTVDVYDKSGTLLSSTPLPNSNQVLGIGVDMTDVTGTSLYITPNPAFTQFGAKVAPK